MKDFDIWRIDQIFSELHFARHGAGTCSCFPERNKVKWINYNNGVPGSYPDRGKDFTETFEEFLERRKTK